tara:strand:- start:19366 stop:19839 length:474 start_codon:yes stop_codon:yes gene_type:complete
MIYSKSVVVCVSYIVMKLKGALALYRLRATIAGVGRSSRCALSTEIKCPENVAIGDYVAIGPACTIGGYGGVILEDYVRVSKGVTIESASLDVEGELPYTHVSKPVHIKNGAWLGARCIILGGVTVGEQAVIGAGAIISKNVPDKAVVVAQPVRKIK